MMSLHAFKSYVVTFHTNYSRTAYLQHKHDNQVNLIKNKVPDGAKTTVYRCGHLVDLCMGPHVSNTGKIKAFASVKTSSTNWLGQVNNDPLQRVSGKSSLRALI